MIERQVITTWYTPEERCPEDGIFVVVSASGKSRNVTLDHALMIAEYYQGEGWTIEGFDHTLKGAYLEIHAWADLEPYGAKS